MANKESLQSEKWALKTVIDALEACQPHGLARGGCNVLRSGANQLNC